MPVEWHPTAILLNDRGIVWHIVHKAASSAIIRALVQVQGKPVDGPLHGTPALTWAMRGEIPDTGWHVVFVRNPFDRLASCYRYHIQNRKAQAPNYRALGFTADMTFPAFVRKVAEDPEADVHFLPQAWQVPRADFVGKVERMDRDWPRLQQHIPVPALKRVNATGGDGWPLYDAKTAETVRAIYHDDFDAFGYSRDL